MRPARGQLIGVGRSRRRSLGRWAQCIHSTLYTGPLLIRGKSDCWPLQLLELELDYQHCPHAPSVSWHKCSELTAVQPPASRHGTVKWTTVDICQVWKRFGWQKNRQLDWHGHVKCSSYVAASSPKCSSDPASITATWQKCSLHSSHLTEVQRAAYKDKAAIWQKCRLHSSHLAEVQDAE